MSEPTCPCHVGTAVASCRVHGHGHATADDPAALQALFDLSPLGMALCDLDDGLLLQINDAMVALLGHGRDQVGTLRVTDLVPAERRPLVQIHAEALASRGRFGPEEVELLHGRGHRVPVLLSGVRVVLPDGRRRMWAIVEDLTPRHHLELRLRAEACTDRLTGLPNRALLMERLEHCVDSARADPNWRFSLLFLDFDRFKLVNDTLGHEAGDRLLQHIAERLRGALRTGDVLGAGRDGLATLNTVARFGGDEFVVLLTDACSPEAAAVVARRLLEVLAEPYYLDGNEVHSSASIGIVMSESVDVDAASLLRNADMAMYQAKRNGRATYAFFDEPMLARVSRAARVEDALRRAMALHQLTLAFQPIVDLDTGHMTSVEALLRWEHPELGTVLPDEFVPIAEESGLILPIGEWVLWQACRQWRRWQIESPEVAPAAMSVNVSRVQLALGDRLLAYVEKVLREFDMPAACLQLEVAESDVMRDPSASRALLRRLRELGVRLAMDDFGTGASSLGCLRDCPFDVIKIDKSFIDDLTSSSNMLAVIHATVLVIENLGMVSIAEGIEAEMQVGVLQSLGCRFGQGYLFSQPLPADQLLDQVRHLRPAEPAQIQ